MNRRRPTIYQRIQGEKTQQILRDKGISSEEIREVVSAATQIQEAKSSAGRLGRLLITVHPGIRIRERKVRNFLDQIDNEASAKRAQKER